MRVATCEVGSAPKTAARVINGNQLRYFFIATFFVGYYFTIARTKARFAH